MFDTNQEVNTIDERILPSTGIITIKRLLDYTGTRIHTFGDIDKVVIECEKHNISIFKPSVNNWAWLICLDDFRFVSREL